MAILSYEGVAVTGMGACVPRNRIVNKSLMEPFSGAILEKTIKTTGIQERRGAERNTCASDLCCEAARSLIAFMKIPSGSIDALIFVTQSPDYRIPATAPLIQHRLGLKRETAAFDVNMGCSGYVYGLSLAYGFAAQPHIERVLLLVGDTPSRYVSPFDQTTGILFGDGGTATIVEKRADGGMAYFSLNSDGKGGEALQIKAGGFRYPSTAETRERKRHKEGGMRSDEELFMDGPAIFNFTIKEVPSDIKKVLEFSQKPLSEIDYLVFHQANRFITDHLSKKIKYPLEKVPYSLDRFGNTTCLTIPLTIVTELKKALETSPKSLILSGFGIGLSWATALLTLNQCSIPELIEV